MGSCLGCSQTEGEKQNTVLSKQLEREKKSFNKIKKILFLGSGGSGKSTIFKQLRGIYGKPFNQQERHRFVSHIHEQVITQMKLALEVLEEYRNGDMDGILHKNLKTYIDPSIDSIVLNIGTIDSNGIEPNFVLCSTSCVLCSS